MRGSLGFIVNDILSQPAIIAGLMAMIGLIALRKPLRSIVTGTLKTSAFSFWESERRRSSNPSIRWGRF